MGMSASQARLIALTARMSDVEYEGQQINQQRLELSNKVSEIYAQMEAMTVPTPPSPQDFMKPVYTGETASGERISIENNGSGGFNYYKNLTGPIVEQSGGQDITTGVAVKLAPPSEVPVGTRKDDVYYCQEVEDVYDKNSPEFDSLVQQLGANGLGQYTLEGGTIKSSEVSTGEYAENEAGNMQEVKKIVYHFDGKIHKNNWHTDRNAIVKVGNPIPEKYEHTGNPITYYSDDKASKQIGNKEAVETKFWGGYTDSEITDMVSTYYIQTGSGNNVRLLTAEDFDASGKLKEGTTLLIKSDNGQEYNDPSQGELSINHREAFTSIKDAEDKYGGTSKFSDAKSALQNVFPEDGEVSYDKFGVIVLTDDKGNVSGFQFFLAEDIDNGDNQVTVWSVTTGTYKAKIGSSDEGNKPTFDASGQPSSVIINGEPVKLSVSKDIDQIAYDSAYADYTREKNVYDAEQNALNNKTSSYQNLDKKLDLKLKRLDTERNALNTEIDAVKKVIQDSTEKGFKTFSG